MDSNDAGSLIRVAEWAIGRFSERQLASATGVVVVIYFRGEMRELVRSVFLRRSLRKRLDVIEAAVAQAQRQLERAQEQVAGLEKLTAAQTPMLQQHGSQLDLVIRLLRAQDVETSRKDSRSV